MEKFSNDQKMQRQMLLDRAFKVVTRTFAFLVLAMLVSILISLIIGSMPSIKAFGFGFLTSSDWDPVNDKFGAAVPIFGTLVTSCIALLIGVPVSFGIALFLTELCPTWLKRPLGIAVELLAGIPSIIYGMWGLFVFAPIFSDRLQPWLIDNLGPIPFIGSLFQGAPMGIGIFTAGLILAIMVIPFIASVMRDVFEVVPTLLKESAYGLGSTTWEVVRTVGSALHQDRCDRRHDAGAGPRTRRNHGGHFRDRQLVALCAGPVPARQFDCLVTGRLNSPKPTATCTSLR